MPILFTHTEFIKNTEMTNYTLYDAVTDLKGKGAGSLALGPTQMPESIKRD